VQDTVEWSRGHGPEFFGPVQEGPFDTQKQAKDYLDKLLDADKDFSPWEPSLLSTIVGFIYIYILYILLYIDAMRTPTTPCEEALVL
jgi:hypothetical protein